MQIKNSAPGIFTIIFLKIPKTVLDEDVQEKGTICYFNFISFESCRMVLGNKSRERAK